MCPPDLQPPVCPEGTTYCVDGKCRESCPASLVSACSCIGAPALVGDIYPCGENNLRTNIENFIAENKANQSAYACSLAAGINGVPNWSPNPESVMWQDCPAPYYGELTFTEDVFIAMYAFYGSCVGVLALWTLFKKSSEKVYICIFM